MNGFEGATRIFWAAVIFVLLGYGIYTNNTPAALAALVIALSPEMR